MNRKIILLLLIAFAGCFALTAGIPQYANSRATIDLSGTWNSSLGTCHLPGTTDENHLGGGLHPTNVTTRLTRLYPYSGIVTYERTVKIPPTWKGKKLFLVMERTKPSTLWVDGDSIGSQGHIYAPHRYELPPLKAGQHTLKICIDNSPASVPQEIQGSHAWTDETQTNWNGILGDFFLEAVSPNYLQDVQVYPDVNGKRALAVAYVKADKAGKAELAVEGYAWNSDKTHTLAKSTSHAYLKKGLNRIEIPIDMGNNPLTWSEFHPALYKLNVSLSTAQGKDNQTVNFGMREFKVEGTQFILNGFKTFLRGKHDACVFPLTGYAPTDVASWRRVFRIAKKYGVNHYRCHSYTPTRAALEAADIEGIYFHVELPLWGAIKRENTRLNDFLLREADGILSFLGNHPSFMMMGLGNELTGDVGLMREWLDKFRQKDKRHLYSYGSNNNLGWKGPQEGEDYFVTCRVGDGEGYSTHVRTSFAFVDADQGGILNNTRPRTDRNYSEAIARCPRPVVGHETCQFQIYPDYSEVPEYTGVLYPYNFEIFRNRLKENHLEGQQAAFHRATGRFAAECYKADIEYALRTPGFGGFQMLDLQDFPGQGSALVGILNAFMETKNIISPERFNGFCAPVVPLALFDDYCLNNSETFRARIDIANYEERDWTEPVKWTLAADGFDWQRQGSLQPQVKQGNVGQAGNIETSLTDITAACRLTLTLTTGKYHNSYHLWVYPDKDENCNAGQSYYTDTLLTSEVLGRLEAGENVLLIPSHASVKQQSVGGLFTPDFWNYAMFKAITENAGKEASPGTLSILTNPTHPLFDLFPTEEHSNWQWWSITRHSRPFILDKAPATYRPLVQVVDNIERNHKLGLFFEFAVGQGKLFVSMCNLQAIASTPEGKQLGRAIRSYIQSDDFVPTTKLTAGQLKELFTTNSEEKKINGVKNQSDYTH